MFNDIINENHKTIILRQLLFTPSRAYDGQNLFRQLDDDAQGQIKVSLGRLVNVWQEAYDILKGRYGSIQDVATLSSQVPSDGKDGSATALSVRKARSPLLMIRWSFRDKKRVETIIADFTKLNFSIHEYIKFICLGSSIGVGLRHLQYLQDDGNSIELGFHVDARLKLTVQQESKTQESLELPKTWAAKSEDLALLIERFTIIQQGEESFLIERRSCEPAGFVQPGTEFLATHRIDALARLLRQPKEQVFRIPRCVGWKHIERLDMVAFVFENPTPQCQRPVSLQQLLRSDLEKPSLNSKFSIAYSLANGVAQLHLVQWVYMHADP